MSEPPVTLCGSLSLHAVALGARMHQAGYGALGLPFTYVPFEITRDELAGAIAAMRLLNIRGLGISMPFKLDVLPMLDERDPLADKIGAVNTVVNTSGRLRGYNTDAIGAVTALRERTELADRSVALIGVGGAARAVAFGLAEAGARLVLYNRTPDRITALAAAISAHFASPEIGGPLSALRRTDVLVNCSSAGMAETGGTSPVPSAYWSDPAALVMDIVYKPLLTPLLRAARQKGCQTVDGGRMLLHQACGQFRLYTGRDAPLTVMDAALQAAGS